MDGAEHGAPMYNTSSHAAEDDTNEARASHSTHHHDTNDHDDAGIGDIRSNDTGRRRRRRKWSIVSIEEVG